MDTEEIIQVLAVVILMILLVIFVPHAFIWSLNVLFGFTIQHTFTNWCASFCLCAIFGTSRSSGSKS